MNQVALEGAFVFKTKPRAHQAKAYELSRQRASYGLFLEQGLGKTKVILDTAAYLWGKGCVDTLLVVAPNGVHAQWINEQVPEHLPDWVPRRTLVYKSTQGRGWLAAAEKFLEDDGALKILAMHQEAFATDKGVAFARRALSAKTLFCIDESVSIKTPGARRTKNIMKLRDRAGYRRILTGTPVTKGIEDLYTQLMFLDDDVHGFKSFYSFRNQYCIVKQLPFMPPGAVKIVGYKNVDELQERMEKWTLRMTADECLDLPERVYIQRPVVLHADQVTLYNQLKAESVAKLRSGEIVTAEQAVTQMLRLQQVLCGHIKDEFGKVHNIATNRAAEALAAAEQASGKVVVWARFQKDIDLLRETFAEWSPAVWDGRTSDYDRAAGKLRFITDDSCRAFIANPATAGIGLDGLQKVSHTMIYYSNSFKAYDRWQSEARLHRDGQRGTVNVIDLVTPKTIDEHILRALKARKDVADMALTALEA